MSTNEQWLQQLNEATDYRELQLVFSQLAQAATATSDDEQLVASIDEAIQRIEHERSRDDQELQQFESQYAEFKEQQHGVLGWFRRHVPFTKTRKQEVQHKGAIADQRAEILADNLVIARAQMLKQKLLSPELRQLGESALRWKTRLRECESIERIRDYASTISALAAEVSVSQAFVKEIETEIDLFSQADFQSKDDRQRQKDDVKQAHAELAEFKTELKEEQSMQKASIKRAGELVSEDMLLSDHEFFQLSQRLKQLDTAKQLAKRAAEKATEFAGLIGEVDKFSDASAANEQEREELDTSGTQLQQQLEPVQQRLERLQRKLQKAADPFKEAQRAADRAEAAFDAAKRIYDQHNATLSQNSGGDVGKNDTVQDEYQRVTSEREAARDAFESAKSPYDAANSEHDRCSEEHRRIEQEIAAVQKKLNDNREQAARLSTQLRTAAEKLAPTLGDFEPLLNDFLQSIDSLSLQSHVEKLNRTIRWSEAISDRFASEQVEERKHQMERLAAALEQDYSELKNLAAVARDEYHQRWSLRCRELLGDELADKVVR